MNGSAGTAAARTVMRETHFVRAPRCLHTLLTKPECHCRACLSEQIAAHGRAPRARAAGR